MNEEQMKTVADSLWDYFLNKYLKRYLSDSVCYYVATVTTAPQNGVIGVTRAFDNEVFLPCAVNAMNLQVDDTCTVLVFGDFSNQMVVGSIDGIGSLYMGAPTNINGVLHGDGSSIGVIPVDAAPTKDSQNLASSGGIYDYADPNYGKGVNLLKNWYFAGGGGFLVPSGTTYYLEPELTTSIGTTSSDIIASERNEQYLTIDISGTNYYVNISSVSQTSLPYCVSTTSDKAITYAATNT